MRITLNGHCQESPAKTLGELLERQGITQATTGIAVARNETLAPKADWPHLALQQGDRIEIIHAVQGG